MLGLKAIAPGEVYPGSDMVNLIGMSQSWAVTQTDAERRWRELETTNFGYRPASRR